MKRHRRIRTGYRIGTKKKPIKKVLLRVLFVLLCAVALTVFSVLLGTHLKNKADLAGSVIESTEMATETAADSGELYPDGVPSTSDAKEIKVHAADIDITLGTPKSIKNKINSLADTYNAVSVRISADDGTLLYVSEALLDYVGINKDSVQSVPQDTPQDEEDTPDEDEEKPEGAAEDTLENLKATIAAADEKKLRKSAVLNTTKAVLGSSAESLSKSQLDSVVIGELFSLGFDEVIIDGLVDEDEGITHDSLRSIISYLAQLRARSEELDIGIVLPASLYLIPQSASIIKTLSEYVDLLAIEVRVDTDDPGVAYSLVFDNCHALKGNFSVYNIRGMIDSDDPDVSCAIMAALTDLSGASVQFSVYVAEPFFDPDSGSVESESETESNPSNDNAKREEDYLEEATATEETEPEAEPETEATAEPESETTAETEAETTAETEAETTAKTEAETTAKTEAETTAKAEAETTAETEAETTAKTEAETTAKAEAETTTKTEAESTTKTESESESEDE